MKPGICRLTAPNAGLMTGPGTNTYILGGKEFAIIEKRFINVWNEMEHKFRKEMLELDKLDTVKKMKMKEDKLIRRIVSF